MLIIKIITTLIIISLTPFVVMRDWRFHDRRKTKHHTITRAILICWLFGCLGSVILIWNETYHSGQLASKIDDLVKGKNQLLTNLAKYQQDIENKDAEIEQLKQITEIIRTFSDVSVLNPAGMPFKEGKGIQYDSPLSTALRDLYIIKDTKIHFKLGEQYEAQYRRIMEQFPRFPFAYFALAQSLKRREDPNWRTYAEQAIAILEKTTMIEGHKRSHDDALRKLTEYLKQE